MKKSVLLLTVALTAILALGANAQSTDTAKKPTSFSARIAADGKTLMADKNNRIWLVSNPETLSGIEGRHIRVKALADLAQGQIRIVSVSAITEGQAGVRLHDAAFRR
jgi:hypothetical protein